MGSSTLEALWIKWQKIVEALNDNVVLHASHQERGDKIDIDV